MSDANRERPEDAGSAKEIYLRMLDEMENVLTTYKRIQRDLAEQLTAWEELYAHDPSPVLADTLAKTRVLFGEFIEDRDRTLARLMAILKRAERRLTRLYRQQLREWVETMRPSDVHD
jgi:hypothetical protein